ncbi:MAG: lysophospholipid acyltransferase family protein [Paracoccaceae bacterium]
MRLVWQYLVSLIFVIQLPVTMAILGILFTPYAVLAKRGALVACKLYARWTIWVAGWMLGLKSEVRGQVPAGEVMIGAKHQSFFDIMLIFDALPQPKFIMKKELLWTPFIGLYAKRLGCIPVDRGKRGATIAKMVQDVAKEFEEPGQLVIYPQGTRVAPGAQKPYKVGSAVLYQGLGSECYPVAVNVGVFWPKHGLLKKPGLAVVEFLDPMPPGMEKNAFMSELEERVEARSNELMREAGFDPDGLR